jgi:hypothetical protein
MTTYRNGHFICFLSAMVDRQARERIQAPEEWAAQHSREIKEFSARLSREEADFARLAATVEAIRASGSHPSPAVPCDGHTPTPTLIQDTGGTFSGASRRWSGTPRTRTARPIRV